MRHYSKKQEHDNKTDEGIKFNRIPKKYNFRFH